MTFLEYYDLKDILFNCLLSLHRVAIGVTAALTLGVTFAVLRHNLPKNFKQNKIINFIIEAPKFPPPIAWIPFVILFFGIGEISAYTIVFIGAFSPIFTSAYEGAESIPTAWKNVAASLELSKLKYLFSIAFMGTLPQIFIGLRSGISMGWMAVIAAEMVSGQSGLGYSIQLNRLNLQYDLMVVDMILIGLIGYLLLELIKTLEKKLMPWHERVLSYD